MSQKCHKSIITKMKNLNLARVHRDLIKIEKSELRNYIQFIIKLEKLQKRHSIND